MVGAAPPPADRWAARGYPAYMTNQNPNDFDRYAYQGYLGTYAPQTLPRTIPNLVGYRADPTNRFGGNDGLETLPTKFTDKGMFNAGSPIQLYSYTRSLAQAQKYGVPQLSAQELAALALKEGRADLGTISFDTKNPSSRALYNQLVDAGFNSEAAKFPVAVAEKAALAKRLGIPFAEAWNGTGSNGASTGAQYAMGYQASLQAASNPKNAQLVQFIQSALNAGRH